MATDSDSGIVPLLTLEEARRVVGVSERHFRRLREDLKNPLRVHWFGRCARVELNDLQKWIKGFGTKPTISPKVLDRISPAARELVKRMSDDTAKDRPMKKAG